MENEEFEVRLAKIEARLDMAEEKLDALHSITEDIHNMAIDLAKLTEQVSQAGTEISTIKANLMDIMKKPAKRYESVVISIITAFVTCIGGFVAAHLGFKF